jgi:hypothetical protein
LRWTTWAAVAAGVVRVLMLFTGLLVAAKVKVNSPA